LFFLHPTLHVKDSNNAMGLERVHSCRQHQ
jgi:hypothetical protein